MIRPVTHVLGARPNFMKAGPVMLALTARGVSQRVVHTGQHYDEQLSEVFFRQLRLPEPDVNLAVGSGSHAAQTAALLVGLEAEFAAVPPALVVVYGDVNSTLAAALVAAKTGVAVAHVEAGLRSFDMTMPEEVNRRVTDLLSDLLFVTSPEAMGHLGREGAEPSRAHFVGNPMIDTLLSVRERLDVQAARDAFGLSGRYAVATLHRPATVDSLDTARPVARALVQLSAVLDVVVPLHPRGLAVLTEAGLVAGRQLQIVDPLGYLEFMALVAGAALVVTDSGGIQEETTVLGVPCLTLRPNTERPVTISHGTNRLVTVDRLVAEAQAVLAGPPVRVDRVPPLWDGRAGERIADVIVDWLAER